MGQISRDSYPLGWNPSQDEFNGDPRALLRADNVTFDDRGIMSLRGGSAPIVEAGSGAVHSLFATLLDNTRYRFAGIDSSVYRNAVEVATGVAGSASDPIAFGTDKKQVFFARSSTRKKIDAGGTVRNWGIDAGASAPTLAALPPNEKSIIEFGAAIPSNTLSVEEGTSSSNVGYDGTVLGSTILTPNATQQRGSMTIRLLTGKDLSLFTSDSGAPTDLIELYLWVQDPDKLSRLTIMIDLSGSDDPAKQFETDMYQYEIILGEGTDISPTPEERVVAGTQSIPGSLRDSIRSSLLAQLQAIRNRRPLLVPGSTIAKDKPPSTAQGWHKFSIPRATFERIGSTSGKGWATARAVRFVVNGTSSVGFDELYLRGGATRTLTGKFTVKYVLAYNSGVYVEKSGESPTSAEIELKVNGLAVTIPQSVITTMDSQVNEIWVYLLGGGLDQYYRFAVGTDLGGAAVVINVTQAAIDAAIANITLEPSNTRPPEDIVGIAGPIKNRLLILTQRYLYLGRIDNPGSFDANQVYRLGTEGERGIWIVAGDDAAYVGTNRTVYRISGTLAEFPDGTVDIRIDETGADAASTACVARDGNTMVYLGPEGLMQFNGSGSTGLRGAIDQLQRGKTRYDVPGWNLGYSPSLARVALLNRFLYVLAPEVATYSTAIYKMDLESGVWERQVYFTGWDATRGFLSLYREPNGLIMAGDNKGTAWQIDDPAVAGDLISSGALSATAIPIVVRSVYEDGGLPNNEKDGWDFRVKSIGFAGNVSTPLTVAGYVDGSASGGISSNIESSGSGGYSPIIITDTRDTGFGFRAIQMRFSGSFNTWTFRGWSLFFRPRPPKRLFWDSGFFDGGLDLVWVREIRLKLRGGDVSVTVTVEFDGVDKASSTVTLTDNVETIYNVPVGREWHGRVGRIKVQASVGAIPTSPDGFELYWCKVRLDRSGTSSEKPELTFSGVEA